MSQCQAFHYRPTLWKTPGPALPYLPPLARSPLLSNSIILPFISEFLDFWDLQALISAGCRDLSTYLHRRCTTITVYRQTRLSTARNQPFLKRDPFDFIYGFPHLTTLTIISPSWTPMPLPKSPLYRLPTCLRHLTLWTTHANTQDMVQFAFIPFPSLFPQLETLRLCPHICEELQPHPEFPLEMIPTNIRNLSIVMPRIFTVMEALLICHPIGAEHELLHAPVAAEEEARIFDEHPVFDRDHDETHRQLSSSWNWRFENLQFFEWGGICAPPARPLDIDDLPASETANIGPIPSKMPPSLRHYLHHSHGSILESLPQTCLNTAQNSSSASIQSSVPSSSSDSPLIQASTYLTQHLSVIPTTGLLTFVEDIPLPHMRLPKSLTRLATHSPFNTRGDFFAIDLWNRLPYLREFQLDTPINFDEMPLPQVMRHLRVERAHECAHDHFTVPKPERQPMFIQFAAPPSLTELTLETCCGGPLIGLPAHLRVLRIARQITMKQLLNGVIPYLPKLLVSLRLFIEHFDPSCIALLPRDLKELTISSNSELFALWTAQEGWSKEPILFDPTGLPPQLEHLSLRFPPYQFYMPTYMLSQLPRTLKSLDIPCLSFSSSPSPISSLSMLFNAIRSQRRNIVSLEHIEQALADLPVDCWCKLWFKTEIEKDAKTLEKMDRQDPHLVNSIRQRIPIPLSFSTEPLLQIPRLILKYEVLSEDSSFYGKT